MTSLGAMMLAQSANAFYVTRRVGLLTTCDYSDIQSAIDDPLPMLGRVFTGINILVDDHFGYGPITINGKNVTIQGGYDNCTDANPIAGNVSSIARSSDSGSVVDIEGTSNVQLIGIDISHGSATAGGGGGILFGGSGTLVLTNSNVHDNVAGFGGGIAIEPDGPTTLTLQSSRVDNNYAASNGGGIWIGQGSSSFALNMILDNGSIVYSNWTGAGGYGGGIMVSGPANAYINGLVQENGLPPVAGGNARTSYGGGIAAVSNDLGTSNVYLYSTASPPQTAGIYGNTASSSGGGIYLMPANNNATYLCAENFFIEGNTAPDGSALEADYNPQNSIFNGPSISLNHDSCAAATTPPEIDCGISGPLCNEINGNTISKDTKATISGSTIAMTGAVQFRAERFQARNNSGANLIFVDMSSAYSAQPMILANCLLADNIENQYLIRNKGDHSAQLNIDQCTLTNNSETAGFTISDTIGFQITNSIVDDPSAAAFIYGTAPERPTGRSIIAAMYDVVKDNSLVENATTVVGVTQGEPTFVAPTMGDYHLMRISLGVDFAPLLTNNADLDGRQRYVDLADIANQYGAVDLGAYEIQNCGASDTIFCSTFE